MKERLFTLAESRHLPFRLAHAAPTPLPPIPPKSPRRWRDVTVSKQRGRPFVAGVIFI